MTRPERPGLAGRLAILVAVLIVLAISTVSVFSVRSLRALAEAEALARVELAVSGGRHALRALTDDMHVAASLLAQRPTLIQLLTIRDFSAVQDYLQRYCAGAELDTCAVVGESYPVVATGSPEVRAALFAVTPLDSSVSGRFVAVPGSGMLAAGSSRISEPGGGDAVVVVGRRVDSDMLSGSNGHTGLALSFAEPVPTAARPGPFDTLDAAALATGAVASGRLGNGAGYGASIRLLGHNGEPIALLRAELSAAEMMQPVRAITMRVLLTGLVVGLFATVAAVLVGRHWAGGVARLTESARKLGAGDLSTRVQPEPGKELSVLSNTMEDMRRGLAELEAARRTRDTVLANISHEFRTPLAAQLASIELLRDSADNSMSADDRELIASLERGTKRLTRLIDNLLESVRIEAGQLAIRRQDVNLAEVVADAIEMIEPLIHQRGQVVEVGELKSMPSVSGDHQRLVQVFVNLLANASKFGCDGGTISIGGRLQSAGTVAIWVEDDGPGPSDPDDTILFSQFRRSRGPDPEQSGLGLGLYIARSIVERHGGRVSLGRTGDARTRATVELPRGESDEYPDR